MGNWPIHLIPYPIDINNWKPINKILAKNILGINKNKKVILENSLTTIDQKGVLTKISAGEAIITNNYNNFIFTKKVKITKKRFVLGTLEF